MVGGDSYIFSLPGFVKSDTVARYAVTNAILGRFEK